MLSRIAIGAALLAGVTTPAYSFDRDQFVGKPKEYLLSCAGVPQRVMRSGNTEFYTYAYSSGGGGFVQMHNWGGFSTGFMGARQNGCQINFTIRSGRIVDAHANWSGGLIAGPMSCNGIVASCQ